MLCIKKPGFRYCEKPGFDFQSMRGQARGAI
jgi:hypothetical protein